MNNDYLEVVYYDLVDRLNSMESDIDGENLDHEANKYLELLIDDGYDPNVLVRMLNKKTIWENYNLLTKAGVEIDLSIFHFSDEYILKNTAQFIERGYSWDTLFEVVRRQLDKYLDEDYDIHPAYELLRTMSEEGLPNEKAYKWIMGRKKDILVIDSVVDSDTDWSIFGIKPEDFAGAWIGYYAGEILSCGSSTKLPKSISVSKFLDTASVKAIVKNVDGKLCDWLKEYGGDIQKLADRFIAVIGEKPKTRAEEMAFEDLYDAGAKFSFWEPKREE